MQMIKDVVIGKSGKQAKMYTPTTKVDGQVITEEKRRKIRASLLSGQHPSLVRLARSHGVSYHFLKRWLESDPELKESYEAALADTAEQIEKAAVDMCLDDGMHPIAREKMIEFCLPRMMPEKYGEQASLLTNSGRGVKKVALVLNMPVVDVDKDGIPIANSKSPLEADAIEVKQ